MEQEKAFTLAEVLITLTIIGVIAALTIPNLMKNYQNHSTYVALNKTYSVLKNAYQLAEREYGPYETWKASESVSLTKKELEYLGEYLKYEKKCENETGCWTKTEKYLNGTPASGLQHGRGNKEYGYTLLDGTNIIIYSDRVGGLYAHQWFGIPRVDNRDTMILMVDINGAKKPNQVGLDVFFICIVGDKIGLLPAGSSEKVWSLTSSTFCDRSHEGIGCADSVLKNKGIKY